MFRDRLDAASQLAQALATCRGRHPLVLAIPRGAVPMARLIAQRLEGDFDVVLVHKLGAPGQPELAIGAVDESGWTYVAPFAERLGADADYLARQRAQQLAVLRERRLRYTPLRPPHAVAGRTVIVVDDGLATGATMIAALHSLRERQPARLICAVPVAPPETLVRVRALADEVVCLHSPADFRAVGQYYRDFAQVEDEEVLALLSD